MTIGALKWFNVQKGFGFINPNDGSKDDFVHISASQRSILTSLGKGQKANFGVERVRGESSAGNLKAIQERKKGGSRRPSLCHDHRPS